MVPLLASCTAPDIAKSPPEVTPTVPEAVIVVVSDDEPSLRTRCRVPSASVRCVVPVPIEPVTPVASTVSTVASPVPSRVTVNAPVRLAPPTVSVSVPETEVVNAATVSEPKVTSPAVGL